MSHSVHNVSRIPRNDRNITPQNKRVSELSHKYYVTMTKNTPHRIPTMSTEIAKQENSVKPLLAYVIDTTPELKSVELQNTIFYIESVFYERTGERLTKIEWNINKTRVSSRAIQNVISTWVENDTIKTKEEQPNNSLTTNTITYYQSMNIDENTRLRDFIRETNAYNPNEPPYSTLTQEFNTGRIPYKELAKFIDETLDDLQQPEDKFNREIQNERDKWTVNEGLYYEWLQRHPLYTHDSRYNNHTTFENWSPKN